MVKKDTQATSNRRFWEGWDGYKVTTGVIAGLLTLFFLLATIMPITLYQSLEDMFWELKTFATSYRPLAALIGLILFLLSGWAFVRILRDTQVLVRSRRQISRVASATAKPIGKAAGEATVKPVSKPAGGATEKPAEPISPTESVTVPVSPSSEAISGKSTPPMKPEAKKTNSPVETGS